MLQAISILLAWLIGFLLVQALDPVRNMQPRWAAVLFHAALGAGIGMGVTSVIFLLLDVSGAASPGAIFGIDIALVGGLAWQCLHSRSRGVALSSSGDATPGFRWTWLLALAFGIVLLIACIRMVQMAVAVPAGEWDAWTLWNLRAKFLAGPSGAWRYALSPLLYGTHPDYPLLLSAFIARVWKAGGDMDAVAPVVTAFAFFASLIALLVSAVALLRGAASAWLAGLDQERRHRVPGHDLDRVPGFHYVAAAHGSRNDSRRMAAGGRCSRSAARAVAQILLGPRDGPAGYAGLLRSGTITRRQPVRGDRQGIH